MSNETHAVSIVPQLQEVLTLSSTDLIQRRAVIKDVMAKVMQEGVHYGTIPNVEKPMLFKAGADLLCNTFRLAPRYVITRTDLGDGHREYEIVTNLTHAVTEQFWGSGLGSCSTMESKYRWRTAARVCPECGKDAIIKGREEYGGGWLCFQRKGGCGAKFSSDDPVMSGQMVGRVENPDISDQWNTILKMSKKRSLADAVITATGAADMFLTPDVEDDIEEVDERRPSPPQHNTPRPPQSSGPVSVVTQQQIGLLMQACSAFSVTEDRLKQYLKDTYKIESRKDIPANKMNDVLAWVKKQKDSAE